METTTGTATVEVAPMETTMETATVEVVPMVVEMEMAMEVAAEALTGKVSCQKLWTGAQEQQPQAITAQVRELPIRAAPAMALETTMAMDIQLAEIMVTTSETGASLV